MESCTIEGCKITELHLESIHDEEFTQTNISLLRRQRKTLQQVMNDTGLSLSQLLRDLIENAYPPIPNNETVLQTLQRTAKPVINEREEDLKKMFSGHDIATFSKFFRTDK